MPFSDKSFSERYEKLGNESETIFQSWASLRGIRYVQYGFDKPGFERFWKMPVVIRATPDFVCEGTRPFFAEVKATSGRVLKLKRETMRALDVWNGYMTVWFFVYRSDSKEYTFISYREMQDICEQFPVKHFKSDNKPFYEINTRAFTWKGLTNDQE